MYVHVFTLTTNPSCTELGSLSVAVSESVNVSVGQGRRVEETSAAGGSLPGLRLNQGSNKAVLSHLMANADSAEPDDDFFDMLVKCQVPTIEKDGNSLFEDPKSDCCVVLQGSRLDDQRCAPPPPPARGPTVPDEDFFSLIMRSQAKRMDEQRVTLPAPNTAARPSSN